MQPTWRQVPCKGARATRVQVELGTTLALMRVIQRVAWVRSAHKPCCRCLNTSAKRQRSEPVPTLAYANSTKTLKDRAAGLHESRNVRRPAGSTASTPGDRHSAADGLCCFRTVRHEATLTGPLDEYEDTVRVMADAFLDDALDDRDT